MGPFGFPATIVPSVSSFGTRPVFGALLRWHREQWGLTQRQLCDLSRVSERAIRNLEAGRTHRPQIASVRQLADGLGLRGSRRREFERAARPAAPPGVPIDRSGDDPPAPASTAVPHQLPAAIGDTTGFEPYVERVAELLLATPEEEPVSPVLISGAGGVGKTTLAIHAAQQLRGWFPDGQLFAELRGSRDEVAEPRHVLARFLRALGEPPASIPSHQEEAAALFRTALAGRRVLVLLDDARDGAHVRPFLPGTETSAVLVTSRDTCVDLWGVRGVWMKPPLRPGLGA